MQNNNMRTLSKCIVTYLIEYLGEFEFIFETILDYESGDQMGSFEAKKPPLGTFNAQVIFYANWASLCLFSALSGSL
jgi:hypothetical protein